MKVCMYVCTVCSVLYVCVCIFLCINVCNRSLLLMDMCLCINGDVLDVCTYVNIFLCVHMYVCMYVCSTVCMYASSDNRYENCFRFIAFQVAYNPAPAKAPHTR